MAQAVAGYAIQALVSVAVGLAVQAIVNALTPPIRQQGPRMGDLKVQSTDYGTYIPSIYGSYQVAGSIIWFENNKIKEFGQVDTVGGKGGQAHR